MSWRGYLAGSLFGHRGTLVLWPVLFAVWMMASSSLEGSVVLTGALVTMALARILAATGDAWGQVTVTFRSAFHFLAYTGTFLVELVSANLSMLSHVYSPGLNIRPGIVRLRTRLTSPIGRQALVNSIALTPGSLVLDLKDESIVLHWLDVRTTSEEDATRLVVTPYERHLEKVFG